MKKENDLLIRATEKLLKISKIDSLKYEIIEKAPPVLWFGNKETKKPVILTLGANPSRAEYLNNSKKEAIQNVKNNIPLNYLDKKRRLFHLSNEQNFSSIIYNTTVQNEIIDSYNNYFANNPYKWFGNKPNPDSYNAEEFLKNLSASYYGVNRFQAIHVDLFPFATISDFTSISQAIKENIFDDNWGQSFLIELIEMFKPKFIIVFGRTNYYYFTKLFHLNGVTNKFTFVKDNNKTCSSYYSKLEFNAIPTIGLSTNLGNPVAFNKTALKEYSLVINKLLK